LNKRQFSHLNPIWSLQYIKAILLWGIPLARTVALESKNITWIPALNHWVLFPCMTRSLSFLE
jgi:hypothetical protein